MMAAADLRARDHNKSAKVYVDHWRAGPRALVGLSRFHSLGLALLDVQPSITQSVQTSNRSFRL